MEHVTHKNNARGIADERANELMDAGVLLGEVYDAKFDEEMPAQAEQH